MRVRNGLGLLTIACVVGICGAQAPGTPATVTPAQQEQREMMAFFQSALCEA